jgi:hypothetical protein
MDIRDEQKDLSILADAFFNNLIIDNCEYGGIGLDSKRPFGNSGVTTDMLEMLEVEPEFKCPNCGEEYSEAQHDYVDKLYRQKLIPYLQVEWKRRDK